MIVRDCSERRGGQLLQRVERARALDRELAVAIAREIDGCLEPTGRRDVLVIFVLVGGVNAQEVAVGCDLVDKNIVDKSAVLVKQAGILGLTGLQFRDRVGGDVVGERAGLRAVDFDLAHVADVEQANARAHRAMLFENAGVLQRHVPAAKVDHLGAHLAVHGMRCGFRQQSSGRRCLHLGYTSKTW